MEAFYVGVRWRELYECAAAKAYDPVILLLALTVHTARRMLKAGMHCSVWLQRMDSLLAGCGQAVAFTRALLYDTLEAVDLVLPSCGLKSYIDDLTQTDVGDTDVLVAKVAHAAITLYTCLTLQTIGTGTEWLTCSEKDLEKHAEPTGTHQSRFYNPRPRARQRGGRRRSVGTRSKRMGKALIRAQRNRILSNINKMAKRLHHPRAMANKSVGRSRLRGNLQ